MGKILKNTLFYGDNLDILREYIDDESIDLIYLDPPFNSNRSYNVLFQDESGSDSEAQITAFDDSWHWGESAEETYYALVNDSSPEIATMISALREFIGTNQMMAYLVMMTIRLIELHRVLKNTGSIYLHCDPTASHYLKIILDTVFGMKNFRNEIIWDYSFRMMDIPNFFNRKHDIIFFYAKSKKSFFNMPKTEWTKEELIKSRKQAIHKDENGIEWIWMPGGKGHSKNKLVRVDEILKRGKSISDVWSIPIISSSSKERLGYPTQKPLEVLERIVEAGSKPGDFILDPFSGCGTAISASHKLNRRWIGIDITQLSIALHKNRLKDMFGLEPNKDYDIIGEPQSLHDAEQLAQTDRFQFEWWALSLIEARPYGGKTRGSDKGIDGVITFTDDAKGNAKQVLVQVKSGHVNSGLIRDFRGTIERENNAVMGIFITLEKPTKNMETEALEAGYYVSPFTNKKHLKIQIITIEELLNGKEPDLPVSASFSTFKKALKVKKDDQGKQEKLDL